MAKTGSEPSTGTKNSFDGDESTEVMSVPLVPAAAAAVADVPQDVEEKDKKYVAPRVIPAAAVPEKQDGAKVVLNIPDAKPNRPRGSIGAPPVPPRSNIEASRQRSSDAGEARVEGDKPAVAEVRARRRAATVKIERPNLGALSAVPADSIDVSIDDEFEPPPPLDSPGSAAAGGFAAPSVGGLPTSSISAGALVQAVPAVGFSPPDAIASAPQINRSRPSGGLETPPTALPIREPPRAEKSRLPWLLGGALTIGAAAAGVFVATRQPDELANQSAGNSSASQAAATGIATAETAPKETSAVQAATTTAPEPSTAPTSATSVAVVTTPRQQPQTPTATVGKTVATPPPSDLGVPPRPPVYTAPRPTATVPRPPPKKTTDFIPSGI